MVHGCDRYVPARVTGKRGKGVPADALPGIHFLEKQTENLIKNGLKNGQKMGTDGLTLGKFWYILGTEKTATGPTTSRVIPQSCAFHRTAFFCLERGKNSDGGNGR